MVPFYFWAGSLGIYRTLVDRIRSGLVGSPSSGNQIVGLFSDCLQLPNHERPFHVEASTLSSLQILLGFLVFSKFFHQLCASSSKSSWHTDILLCRLTLR